MDGNYNTQASSSYKKFSRDFYDRLGYRIRKQRKYRPKANLQRGNYRRQANLQRGNYPRQEDLQRGNYPRQGDHQRGNYPRQEDLQHGNYPRQEDLQRGDYPRQEDLQRGDYPRQEVRQHGDNQREIQYRSRNQSNDDVHEQRQWRSRSNSKERRADSNFLSRDQGRYRRPVERESSPPRNCNNASQYDFNYISNNPPSKNYERLPDRYDTVVSNDNRGHHQFNVTPAADLSSPQRSSSSSRSTSPIPTIPRKRKSRYRRLKERAREKKRRRRYKLPTPPPPVITLEDRQNNW